MNSKRGNKTMDKNNPPKQQINVELGEKEAEGIYSNLAIISHSQAEFIFDFTRILPGTPKAKVLSRIIMTPQHAKLLLNALNDNLSKFEQMYGEVKVEAPNGGNPLFPNGFAGLTN